MPTTTKPLLILECLSLFFLIPALAILLPSLKGMFTFLWVAALFAAFWLKRHPEFTKSQFFDRKHVTWHNLKPIFRRFLISCIALSALVYALEPSRFMSMPLDRPLLWVMIMFFYPLLSVYPQEIIFRAFFFLRYRTVFSIPRTMVIANGLAFGFSHIIFLNWVALLLCIAGGFIFASTYQKHKSLLLVCIEHALYGCFIFTVGLGYFFYSGAAR